jgi:transposase
MRRRYPTDLSDTEWRCIEPYITSPNRRGRPRIHCLRRVLDAVFFYILRSGCAWRLSAREFPPWRTVYYWFRKWRIEGTFERLNAVLRERLRTHLGRNAQPSAGIADSQSAQTTAVGGEQRAYEDLASLVLGDAATQNPPDVEVTRVDNVSGPTLAFLVRSPEPIAWERTEIELLHADRPAPLASPPGDVKLADVTFGTTQPNEESVTLLLREATELTGRRIEYRAFGEPLSSPTSVISATFFR